MQYTWLALFIVIFLIILPQARRRKSRRKILHQKERKNLMNELIESMIGKRVEISGDLYIGGVGKILSAKDGWLEFESDSGQKTLINTLYISKIREMPEKKKK